MSMALTLNQSEPGKPLAAANGRRREILCLGGGHNFLLKVIKEGIASVKAFS